MESKSSGTSGGMTEEDICTELCVDILSDAPDDCTEESEDSDSELGLEISGRRYKRKSTRLVYSDSDSEGTDNDSNFVDTAETWNKNDFPRILEEFHGKEGIINIPDKPESILEVVKLFFGEDLFEMMCKETNLYHMQNESKYKHSKKTRKWTNVTVKEMKVFLAIIILMGKVRKDSIREYWSTDAFIETPIFGNLLSRNRFEQIWNFWHFSDNESNTDSADRLYKIRPIVAHFLEKFKTVYSPKRELSLDEGVIPWRGRLRFRTYNPGKLVKYGLLVRMVCESETGYICNFEIYTAEGKKLEETILSLLEPCLYRWHHVFQDNYYNSVQIAETLLAKKTRVCGTIRANRGLPTEFRNEMKNMKKGDYMFCRKGEVLLLAWKDKREVRMISTIHDAGMGEGKPNRWTGEIKKKPNCILEYNKYMGGVDRADMYLAYFSLLRKSMKWTKKVVLWLINCALFNSFVTYKTLNRSSRESFQKFVLEVAKGWAKSEEERSASSSDDGTELDEERPTQRAPRRDHPARLSGVMMKHTLEKIVGKGKKQYPSRMCRVCSAKKLRKETRYICAFCKVPLHKGTCFTQYHTRKKY